MGAADFKVDKKRELFESVPVPRAITTMAIPTVISQLISVVYTIVDSFFIGRTGNAYMVASVSIAFTLYMMTVAMSNLFGIGGGSLAARLLGQGRGEDARRVTSFSFYGAAAIGLAYGLFAFAFMDPMLRILGASDATIGFTRQYVWLVIVLGSVPTIVSTVGAHLLRNMGYSRQASVGLSGGGVLNIILDPIFMFVLLPDGMEVFGAALATLLSNSVSCAYIALTLWRVSRAAPVSIDPRHASAIRRQEVKDLFATGIPSAVLTAMFDLANIVLNNQMAIHGDLQLAAIGIVMKLERLPKAVNLGISQGMMPIVAYNYASGNRKRMNQVINTAIKYGLVTSVIGLAFFFVFASPAVNLFLNTSASNVEDALITIGLAAGFLRVRCLAGPVQFLNFHISYCLQAMGDGRDTLLHACARQLVFYIPFMLILNSLFGETGLAWALLLGEGGGALFAWVLLQMWLKRVDRKQPEERF